MYFHDIVMHMSAGNPALEEKLLEFLVKRVEGGSEARFHMREAAEYLHVSRAELEEALLNLERRGLVKIVRMPFSDKILEYVRGKLLELDYEFLSGSLSYEEYFRRREEVVGVLPQSTLKQSANALGDIAPLPPLPASSIFESMRNNCLFLRKLADRKGELRPETYEKLRGEYEKGLVELSLTMSRVLSGIRYYVKRLKGEIERLNAELEALAVDEQLRGVNLSVEKSRKQKAINDAKRKLKQILDSLYPKGTVAEPVSVEEAQKLRNELEVLKIELETLTARILIEGVKEQLIQRRNEVEERIKKLEQLLESMKASEAKSAGLEAQLEEAIKELEELKNLGLVKGETYEVARKSLLGLKDMNSELIKLLKQ